MASYTLSSADHESEQRDPKWTKVRDKYLNTHNKCVVCGSSDDLQIHHMFPVSFIRALGRPELELNPDNFMTLCESESGDSQQNHHILIGHLGNFDSMNENVVADAKTYKGKTSAEIKADADWKAEEKNRPNKASDMTATEKAHILSLIEAKFGKK